ncbi:ATP-binding protein [Streptomyces orinoci]|uniref:AAA family ATPase n=1 Tax=Streptomyces orinoci TaxID=67339 RepID=A0ABV3K821_STRON|nr:helix-turn-helix transcriptional regulator [Streptomyces orinoci]
MLYGRDAEQSAVAGLLERAWDGQGGALLIHGIAGIGKSALLGEAARRAGTAGSAVRVLRATGVEAEARLPFAALHLLLRPVLTEERLAALPGPQRRALCGALGLADEAPEDRFRTGLAVLTLLSHLAAEQPLLCLVDDVQWLDPSSAEALLFAARRLEGEPIAFLLAARDPLPAELRPLAAGIPDLRLASLDATAAGELLAERVPGLAAPVRERVIVQSGGHPLALVELPSALTTAQQAGAAPLPDELPVPNRLLVEYQARIEALGARTVLLVAAAEGSGELGTVLAAAGRLGAGAEELRAAEHAGLIHLGGNGNTGSSQGGWDGILRFRHPLIRAAAYQGAEPAERRAAHRALADVLDADRCPDRIAWHLAAAADGPDEEVASRLERVGQSAWERGAFAASIAGRLRAAELSATAGERARRLLSAAQVAVTTGRVDQAGELAGQALELTADRRLRAGLGMVRGAVADANGDPRAAAYIFLDHAEPMVPVHRDAAVPLLVLAWRSAWAVADGALVRRVAELAGRLGPEHLPEAALMAVAALNTAVDQEDWPMVRRAMNTLRGFVADVRDHNPDSHLIRLLAMDCAVLTGDDEATLDLAAAEAVRCFARSTLLSLGDVLGTLATVQLVTGRKREAESIADEAESAAATIADVAAAPRDRLLAVAARVSARTAASAGDERALDAAGVRAAGPAAVALLDLGLGRYEQALCGLEDARRSGPAAAVALLPATGDLVEAAVRAGVPERAAGPLAAFTAWAEAGGQSWAGAMALRCAALTGPEEEAEKRYQAALARHREGGRPFEQARTELLYGEWLRRARRRTDARPQLRHALAEFKRLGAIPWAERARVELRAVGDDTLDAPVARPDPLGALTPQERQVVRLAAGGVGNRDIAARLFLSSRTVEYHLYKAYPKLGIGSRRELAALLADPPR